MSELTLVDLVRNGTMNAEIAATLASIAAERRSFMVVAVPRFAGKTTVTDAMLHCLPADVPVHRLSSVAVVMGVLLVLVERCGRWHERRRRTSIRSTERALRQAASRRSGE